MSDQPRRLKNHKQLHEFDISKPTTVSLIFLSVLFVWLLFSYSNHESFIADKAPDVGRFGDSYGVATSLFTALAFAGLIYTVFLQRKELEETRDEFKKQNATLKLQLFETTFFNLLKSLETRRASAYTHIARIVSNELTNIFFSKDVKDMNQEEKDATLIAFQEKYESVYEQYLTHLQPYIRTVHALLSIIEETTFSKNKKSFYVYLLYSTLTVEECTFLQYHSKLSLDRENGLQKRLKKITKFAGITKIHNANDWLFEDYERPDDRKDRERKRPSGPHISVITSQKKPRDSY